MSRFEVLTSLKARIAIFATILFVTAIWGMAFRAADELRDDERRQFSAQQLAAAGFIADSIGAAVRLRVTAMRAVAAGVQPDWLTEPSKLDRYLAERQSIYRLFDKGLCVIGRNGRCIADFPQIAGRSGANYAAEDYFQAVIATGQAAVGRPRLDPLWRQAAVVVAAPITNEKGETVGVLAGTMLIAGNDMFQVVTHPRVAAAGTIQVVSPKDGAVVIDTDSTHILDPLPPDDNMIYRRALSGTNEASDIVSDSRGVEQLISAASVGEAGWIVVNSMPTAEAFAPIAAMAHGIYIDAALISLLVAGLIWLFVRSELAALARSAKALNDMTTGAKPFHPLPVEGSAEIAQMVESFNNLQEQMVRQQVALKASEARFRQMFEGSSWITYLLDPETRQIVDANRAAAEFWGYSVEELQGMDMCRINTSSPNELAACYRIALADEPVNRAWQHRLKSGELRDVETFICPLQHGNRTLLYVVAFDITERKRREELETVRNRMFELLSRGRDLKQILGLVVRYVEQKRGETTCAIMVLDEGEQHLRLFAGSGLPDFYNEAIDSVPIAEGMASCGTAAFRNKLIVVEDVSRHPFWKQYRYVAERAGLAACWSEPIRDSSDRVIGTFDIYAREPGPPGPADLGLMQHIANLAAVAIEKKRSEAGLQLASSVYQASDQAIVVTDADNCIIAVNPAFSRLTGYGLEEVRGRNPKLLASGRTTDEEYQAMWRALVSEGQWQGEFWNRRKNGEEFAAALTINTLCGGDGRIQRHIAMFSDITERKRTAELVWRQANYDSLTGLPNRNLFYDRLSQEVRKARRSGQLLALLYIDLDRFKEVNDAYGHDAGDMLLRETAGRIAACVRDTDTVARLSGDEFAVVLPGIADISRVEQVARDIVLKLSQTFHIGSNLAYVSASVGIAICPNDADEMEALVKAADRAMYAAKEAGRNGFSYVTESVQSAATLRMQLGNNLREALAKQQFEIHYQPIVDLPSRRIVKAEALLRWRHPEHGLIQPAAFIPLAEELGLIGEIGDWVFRESAQIARQWQDRDPTAPAVCCPVQISINKSPRQFHGSGRYEGWLDYLKDIGLPNRFIALEITESLLLDNSPEVVERLADLRASGVQVALDDFGTGYSSMSYLNKFHVDYVKIDQTFVQGLPDNDGDKTIVEAIIAMAHKLRLKVIAEGVETEAQHDFLVAAGCDFAQGFLFAEPLPRPEFEALLFSDLPLPARPKAVPPAAEAPPKRRGRKRVRPPEPAK
ncbi:MAG TPA: EAL domain-containing protein [Rhodocyclaceae bacterium]